MKVFRLITQNTIEEKILDRALKKLHLDALVIQQGRLAEKEKAMGKDEMMSAIRYGADDIFKSEGDAEEIDIDAILAKAEATTAELNKKFEDAKKDGLSSSMWTFGGEDFERTDRFGSMGAGFIDIGKRDRKATSYSEQAYFKNLDAAGSKDSRPKIQRAKEVTFYDYQFFDEDALRPLLEKERGIVRTIDEKTGVEKVCCCSHWSLSSCLDIVCA